MKKLLVTLILCLPLVFTACNNDDEPDFDVPQLTDDNTIQFTLKIDDKFSFYFDALLGEKTAIDWGDGKMEKMYATDTDAKGHKFKSAGTYRIKVWSEHLTLFSISGLFHSINDLHIGNCPKLEIFTAGGLVRSTSFKVGKNCPNLKDLNIGNWADLESFDVSECTNLETLSCYTHPKLKTLDVSANKKLFVLRCTYNGLTRLVIGDKNIMSTIDCSRNNLTELEFGDLSLGELVVDNNKLTSLDLSKMENLSTLICDSNRIATLDISANKRLGLLSCSNNLLTSFNGSNKQYLTRLNSAKNQMEAQALNDIFTALPNSPTKKLYVPSQPQKSTIMIYENPGTTTCNTSIITDKDWMILERK